MDDVDRSRRSSFDRAADIYHLIRPGYPAELFEELFALLPPKPRMLEVGPGTGQATRDLLARGATRYEREYRGDEDFVVLVDPDGNRFCVVD